MKEIEEEEKYREDIRWLEAFTDQNQQSEEWILSRLEIRISIDVYLC